MHTFPLPKPHQALPTLREALLLSKGADFCSLIFASELQAIHQSSGVYLFIYVFMYLFIYLGEKSPYLLPVHHIVAGRLVSSALSLGTCGISPAGGI